MDKVTQEARFVFTFGHGQEHFPGYVVVYGRDEPECRQRMTDQFGRAWSMEYRSEEEAGVERWHLPLIATIDEPVAVTP